MNSLRIKTKVILLIGTLIALAMVSMTGVVLYLAHIQISSQTRLQAQNELHTLQQQIMQRARYLIENTELLASNKLMINALTDAEGRKNYLPPLIENFTKGKDVKSLNLVDFDGKPIFQTTDNIPRYNESSQLRTALAMGALAYYIQVSDHQMVVVAPIKYYETTQGALVVVYDIKAIAQRHTLANKRTAVHLIADTQRIASYNYLPQEEYHPFIARTSDEIPLARELGLSIEIGIPDSEFRAPLTHALILLLASGVMFTGFGVFFAYVAADRITKPILELYKRVNSSKTDNEVMCSPLGTHDELEELAVAFDERTLQLQYQAEHDSLTDLPNRVLMIDRLTQAIKLAERTGTKLAILFLDLDRFKEVNDSFGHSFGDDLLKRVSELIESAIRTSDSVARLGGDEFIILVDRIDNDHAITTIGQKLITLFQEPFTIKEHQFFITCSIGIAVYPAHGTTSDELLRNADAAMYKAKNEGRNKYHFYSDDMTQQAVERVTLETQMRRALDNDEFEVYFQPQVDMQTGKITGMEALIRWNHPEMGLVPPNKFIPLAEDTGMIVQIDRWVMRSAMQQFAAWIEQGFDPGILSINLSMIQLNHKDFINQVKITIFDSHLDPARIMFEITETQIMRNPEQAIIILNQLRELGVGLAVDDFGTGHSSLSYIKRLPIGKIKIDQSFVRDIPKDADDMKLTQAIISLSRSLGLNVIAEGVETDEQVSFLMANDCYEAQGYLYHRPQNTEAVTTILQQAAHT